MNSSTTYEHDYPLLTVVVVALASMMFVIICGVYAEAIFPKPIKQIVYECDFKMKDHTVTLPCTTRGVYYD